MKAEAASRLAGVVTCLDENDAVALVLGEADRVSAAREHIATCEACRTLVAGVARVVLPDTVSLGERWPAQAEPLPPGTRVASYVVTGMLGRGGMGVVHAARDDRLKRDVALKMLRGDAYDDAAVRRLRREARIMARLCHPNVLTIHDVGMSEHGPFMAMELIDGLDLGRWRAVQSRTRAEVLDVFAAAGRGLQAAHDAGIVHRDFKPANVLVGRDRVVVADFGLAVDEPAGVEASSSIRGEVAGTVGYMAPEVLDGEPATERSDQFSYCVALYEVLTGIRPFDGSRAALLLGNMRAGRQRRAPARLSRRLRAALTRGLSFEPAERFESMVPLLNALEARPLRVPVALALGGVAVVAGVAGFPGEDDTECAAPPELGASRAALASALADGGGPSAEVVLRRIDRYAADWRSVYTEACTGLDASQQTFDLTMLCLRSRRKELDGIVGALFDADAGGRARLHRAAGQLLPATDCLDESYLAARFRGTDPQLHEQLAELTTLADQTVASDATDLYPQRIAELEDLRVRAEAAGELSVAADAARIKGVLATLLSDYPQAERHFEEAFFLAQFGKDRRLAFAVALDLANVHGDILREIEAGAVWIERARMLVDRDDNRRLAELLIREAQLMLASDRPDAARELFDEAERTIPHDAHPPTWIDLYNGRAGARAQAGDPQGAAKDWEAALQLTEAELGPDHPDALIPLNGLGIVSIMLDDHGAALSYLQRVLAFEPAVHGAARGYSLANLALLYAKMGEHDKALQAVLEAKDVFVRYLGVQHPLLGQASLQVAEAYADLGRYEEAEAELRWALDLDLTPELRERAQELRARFPS